MLWWLCVIADMPVLLPASQCWALTFAAGKESRQPLCPSQGPAPSCSSHSAPSTAEAFSACPAQALMGDVCVLDWPEWDCCSWEPGYFPPTTKWVHKVSAKCTVRKNWIFDKDVLEKENETFPFY